MPSSPNNRSSKVHALRAQVENARGHNNNNTTTTNNNNNTSFASAAFSMSTRQGLGATTSSGRGAGLTGGEPLLSVVIDAEVEELKNYSFDLSPATLRRQQQQARRQLPHLNHLQHHNNNTHTSNNHNNAHNTTTSTHNNGASLKPDDGTKTISHVEPLVKQPRTTPAEILPPPPTCSSPTGGGGGALGAFSKEIHAKLRFRLQNAMAEATANAGSGHNNNNNNNNPSMASALAQLEFLDSLEPVVRAKFVEVEKRKGANSALFSDERLNKIFGGTKLITTKQHNNNSKHHHVIEGDLEGGAEPPPPPPVKRNNSFSYPVKGKPEAIIPTQQQQPLHDAMRRSSATPTGSPVCGSPNGGGLGGKKPSICCVYGAKKPKSQPQQQQQRKEGNNNNRKEGEEEERPSPRGFEEEAIGHWLRGVCLPAMSPDPVLEAASASAGRKGAGDGDDEDEIKGIMSPVTIPGSYELIPEMLWRRQDGGEKGGGFVSSPVAHVARFHGVEQYV